MKELVGIDTKVLMQLFAFLILIDFITGIITAAKEGTLRSRTCCNGIFRSLGELVILSMFIVVSIAIPSVHSYLILFITLFIIKELLSVFENLQKLGVWLPKFITNTLPSVVESMDDGKLPKPIKKIK
jgi:toxin secretion/phage lysis holin